MTHHIVAAATSLAVLLAFVAGLHAFTSSLQAVSHSTLEAYAESAWHDADTGLPQ